MVTALPGPSAALAALSTCGLPTDHFFSKASSVKRCNARPHRRAEATAGTLVLYEAEAVLPSAC